MLNNFNQIYWTAQVITNTKKIIIEKSANGINFDYIGELTGDNALKPSNKFTDYSPFVANNYYRLCVVSNTGEKEYSNIILLKRKDKFLFTVSPNPTKDVINIQMFTDFTDTYQISVFDILGKIVSSKRIATNTNVLKTTLDISNVSNGVYQLIVTDKYQNKVARQSIVVAK